MDLFRLQFDCINRLYKSNKSNCNRYISNGAFKCIQTYTLTHLGIQFKVNKHVISEVHSQMCYYNGISLSPIWEWSSKYDFKPNTMFSFSLKSFSPYIHRTMHKTHKSKLEWYRTVLDLTFSSTKQNVFFTSITTW